MEFTVKEIVELALSMMLGSNESDKLQFRSSISSLKSTTRVNVPKL